jgi:hypothetical protein
LTQKAAAREVRILEEILLRAEFLHAEASDPGAAEYPMIYVSLSHDFRAMIVNI